MLSETGESNLTNDVQPVPLRAVGVILLRFANIRKTLADILNIIFSRMLDEGPG